MNGSIKKNISVIIVVLLAICLFMNHRIKISSIENSVDEELVKLLVSIARFRKIQMNI